MKEEGMRMQRSRESNARVELTQMDATKDRGRK